MLVSKGRLMMLEEMSATRGTSAGTGGVKWYSTPCTVSFAQ